MKMKDIREGVLTSLDPPLMSVIVCDTDDILLSLKLVICSFFMCVL